MVLTKDTFMKKFAIKMLQRLQSERGASAIEYALLVGLIAVAIIALVMGIGGQLVNVFQKVNTGLSSVS
jgi:pilus assembly protein Flp/PilA